MATIMRPILFNTDMVTALLRRQKTVTRRAINPQPPMDFPYCHLGGDDLFYWTTRDGDDDMMGWWPSYEQGIKPPCQPGDILYVRETWRVQSAHRFEADARIEFKSGGPMSVIQFPGGMSQSHSRESYDEFISKWGVSGGWHPSIHMPRDAARIFLRVTGVWVEQLHEITEHGAKQEGVSLPLESINDPEYADYIGGHYGVFRNLWDRTIKPAYRAVYGWDANPWVWVIEFDLISRKDAQI